MQDLTNQDDIENALINDIAGFAYDPLGYVLYAFPWGEPGTPLEDYDGPEDWQKEILEEVGRKLRAGAISAEDAMAWVIQVALSSGHGAGKSAFSAMILHWGMSTMPDTRGVVTANTATQLKTKTWAELAKWHSMCINAHWFEISATSMYSTDPAHKDTWRIDAIPWTEQKSEAFAGLHNKGRRIIVIFDEASAIPPIIWQVTEGALTDERTEILWFVFGNPTRSEGRFHDCFFRQRKYWITRKIDSRTVKITNKAFLQSLIDRYGEDSDIVKVRVKGEFPSTSVSQLIGADLIEAAKDHSKGLIKSDLAGVSLIFGLDVARFGDDNSVLWMRQGVYTKRIFSVNGYDTVRLTNLLIFHMKEMAPAAVFIDISGGLGAGVYDMTKTLGYKSVFPVNFGEKATKSNIYRNKRCEIYGECKEWLINGGCLPSEGEESENISEDLTAVDYFIDDMGRIALEDKADIKEKLGRSPDDGDALCLTFAAPVAALAANIDHTGVRNDVADTSGYDPMAF